MSKATDKLNAELIAVLTAILNEVDEWHSIYYKHEAIQRARELLKRKPPTED